MDSLWTHRNITSLDGSCCEAIDWSISQNIFSYLEIFSMQCRKNITVEDNEEEWIQLTLEIYMQIYIPILYAARMTQNKNGLMNWILQPGCVVDKNCCVLCPNSGYPC